MGTISPVSLSSQDDAQTTLRITGRRSFWASLSVRDHNASTKDISKRSLGAYVSISLSPDDSWLAARPPGVDNCWCLHVHNFNSTEAVHELWTNDEEGRTVEGEAVFDHDSQRLYAFLWDEGSNKLKLRIWAIA